MVVGKAGFKRTDNALTTLYEAEGSEPLRQIESLQCMGNWLVAVQPPFLNIRPPCAPVQAVPQHGFAEGVAHRHAIDQRGFHEKASTVTRLPRRKMSATSCMGRASTSLRLARTRSA